jgi:3-phosphoshikimate 1-carboxyvinyltransferase
VIERLAVVGIGLLGGSVAKAARTGGLAREIVGIGRDPERLAPAVTDGTLTRATTDLADGLQGADLVVLAGPVLVNESLLERAWPLLEAGAVVTDVGSTKVGLARVARRLSTTRSVAFVGSHPMAGSEKAGYGVARADLFRQATVIVTPIENTEPTALKKVSGFWEATGARVSTLDPEMHDRVVAAISHLPHLVSDALVEAVSRFEPAAFEFAARGFKDTTRIAAADPVMWQEIFTANREALVASLKAFRAALDDLEALVVRDDPIGLQDELARIKRAREAVR